MIWVWVCTTHSAAALSFPKDREKDIIIIMVPTTHKPMAHKTSHSMSFEHKNLQKLVQFLHNYNSQKFTAWFGLGKEIYNPSLFNQGRGYKVLKTTKSNWWIGKEKEILIPIWVLRCWKRFWPKAFQHVFLAAIFAHEKHCQWVCMEEERPNDI